VKNNGYNLVKIEILRFPLIIGDCFIHNYTSTIRMVQGSIGVEHSSAWDDFVRFLSLKALHVLPSPILSGLRLFVFPGQWSWSKYAGKLKRRVNTLLIPFLSGILPPGRFYTAGRRISNENVFWRGVWPPAGQVSFLGYIGALFGISRAIRSSTNYGSFAT